MAEDQQTLLNLDYRISIGDPSNYGSLVYSVPCGVAIGMVNSFDCAFAGWSNNFPISSVSNCQYTVMPVCDPTASVSVGQVMTLRGLVMMSLLILLVHLTISVWTFVRSQVTTAASRQRRLDLCRPLAEASASQMSRIVEEEWGQLEMDSTRSRRPKTSPRFETGDLKSRSPSTMPKFEEVFSSSQWKYKVVKSLGTESRARRKVALFLQKLRTGIAVWLMFFALVVGVMQLMLYLLPLNYFSSTHRSLVSMLLYDAVEPTAGDVLSSSTIWIDFLVVVDVVLELFLLIISGLVVFQWPSLPVKTSTIVKVRTGIRRGSEATDFKQAAADGAVYTETIGAVILVRENCSSEARKNSFVKRLQTLLTMFPPDSIFVVDSHGHSSVPVDTTWETVHNISPLIKYCFVPESESKFFALHWFNSVWFPFLVKSGQVQNLSHLLVMGGNDADDVGGILPSLAVELTLPRENLVVNSDNLRALYIPISASPNLSGNSSCWVPCQDFDLKLRAIRQHAQSRIGSASEVELCVGVWEREALSRCIRNATSSSISPLEQFRTGLEVVKMRNRNHTKSNPFVFACTSAPSKFSDLVTFRFRNNYAGDIVKTGAAARELLSVFSLCNVESWSIKPFLLLGTIVSGFCQILRPFIIGTLVVRDPMAIGCLAVLGMVVIILIEMVLLLVFSSRSDLRHKWSLCPILLYPIYRGINCWLIELPTLFEYILGGCVRNACIRPEKRVRDLQDVPACPPCHVVNWFTVWKVEDETGPAKSDKLSFEDELEDTRSSISPKVLNSRLKRGA